MLVPDPADQVVRVILILGKPELAFFADDIEDLKGQVSTALNHWLDKTRLTSPAT